ncbi:MAG: LCP family protein [Ruminococcus sp.]|nr:LCP family protein [Ruminococcus sp.]
MSKAKKKRSQAPVALVYFITLLVFMAVFGFIAFQLLKKVTIFDKNNDDDELKSDRSFSIMMARLDSTGSLMDIGLFKFMPDDERILIVPLPGRTVNDSTGVLMSEVYQAGGIRSLENAVENTLGISVDYYITVEESAFETVFDIIGGVVFTADEELYRLTDNDAEDISYQAGIPVELTGIQARVLLDTKIFSNGYQGNLNLQCSVLQQLVNSAFRQANLTKNSLDNIYDKLVGTGETNYTAAIFREHKQIIIEMLDKKLKPGSLFKPDGEWRDEERYVLAATFKNSLQEIYGIPTETEKAAMNAESTDEE